MITKIGEYPLVHKLWFISPGLTLEVWDELETHLVNLVPIPPGNDLKLRDEEKTMAAAMGFLPQRADIPTGSGIK